MTRTSTGREKRAGLTTSPTDWPRVRKVLQRVFGCESHWGSDMVSSDEIWQRCTHLSNVAMDQDLEVNRFYHGCTGSACRVTVSAGELEVHDISHITA